MPLCNNDMSFFKEALHLSGTKREKPLGQETPAWWVLRRGSAGRFKLANTGGGLVRKVEDIPFQSRQ